MGPVLRRFGTTLPDKGSTRKRPATPRYQFHCCAYFPRVFSPIESLMSASNLGATSQCLSAAVRRHRMSAGPQEPKAGSTREAAAPCRRSGPVRRSGAPAAPGCHRRGPLRLTKAKSPSLTTRSPLVALYPELLQPFWASRPRYYTRSAPLALAIQLRVVVNILEAVVRKIFTLYYAPVILMNRALLRASSKGNIMPMGLCFPTTRVNGSLFGTARTSKATTTTSRYAIHRLTR